MNELDKHLTTALQAMNRATQQRLDRQAQAITGHNQRLDAQANAIKSLQQTVSQIQAQQLQFGQALQDLNSMSATLPPLLTKLDSLLAGK